MADDDDLFTRMGACDPVQGSAGPSGDVAKRLAALWADAPTPDAGSCRMRFIEVGIGPAAEDAEALLMQIIDDSRDEAESSADLFCALESATEGTRVERRGLEDSRDRPATLTNLFFAERRERLVAVTGKATLSIRHALTMADHDQ